MAGSGTQENPWDLTSSLASASVGPGDTVNLMDTENNYVFDGYLGWNTGVWNGKITLQPHGSAKPTIDGNVIISGRWNVYKGLHITDVDYTDRYTDELGDPQDIPSGGIRVSVSDVLLEDCIVENCAQGILRGSGTEYVVFDGCIIFHNGWRGPDRPHGHGLYINGAMAITRNCIIFSNACFGMQVYDEGLDIPPSNDQTIEDTIAFNNYVIFGIAGGHSRGDILLGHLNQNVYRPIVRRNYTYQLPEFMEPDGNGNTNTNFLGYRRPVRDGILVDNYFPNGLNIYTGSTFLQNSGNVLAPETQNKIVVIPVRSKAHVAIYNWKLLDGVTVDLSTTVFTPGQSVKVTNVQDIFVDIVTAVVDENCCIAIDMRAANHTVMAPRSLSAPATTFPQFGCFIIEAG